MVFTPPKNYTNNKHYKNSKLYNELKSDYEKIIKHRSSLYKLVEEYSNTIAILEGQLKEQNNILEDKDSVIEYWKTTCNNLINRINENKISKSVDSFTELNYLKKKEIEWQDYANDFVEELSKTKLELDNTKEELKNITNNYNKSQNDLFDVRQQLEQTESDLYETNELNISLHDKYKIEIDKLKKNLKISHERYESLANSFNQDKIKQKDTITSDFNIILQDKTNELLEIKDNYCKLKQKYNNILSDFSEMDNFIQSQDKQLTDYKTNNTNLAKKLNDTNQQFKIKQDDFQITIERLREIISTKKHKIKKLEQEIESLQKNDQFTCRINMKNADLVDKTTITELSSEPSFYLIENDDFE